MGAVDEFADTILSNDDQKKQFIVYDNTIDALYDACKPEILTRRKDFPLAAIIHYLREVIDGRVDRGNLDSAKRRISQLLDESIVAEDVRPENQSIAGEIFEHFENDHTLLPGQSVFGFLLMIDINPFFCNRSTIVLNFFSPQMEMNFSQAACSASLM